MKSIKAFVLSFLIISSLFAAENGSIKGKVIDKTTKKPLIGANVTVQGTKSGGATDSLGFYFIQNVPENIYILNYSYLGYEKNSETEIRVTRGKTTYVKEVEMSESPIKSREVSITASAFKEDKDLHVSNFGYSKQEIIRSPGSAGDILRAIETMPGVSTMGGEFNAFSVRGGSPKDNIILIDNIPFSKISHFASGSEDEEAQGGRFSIFSPGLIESASFQAGGFPARYGGKNASFLDLKLKEGNRDDFTANGTYDLLGWEVNYDGPTYLLKNTSLVLSARQQDYKTLLEMIDEFGEGHPKLADYIFKTTTDISSNHKISITGIYSTETFIRTPDHIFKAKNLDNQDLYDQSEDKYLLGLNWRYLLSGQGFLQTSLYFENTDSKSSEGHAFTDPVNGIQPTINNLQVRNNIYVNNQNEKQFGIKSVLTYQLNKNTTFITGAELNRFGGKFNRFINGIDTLYEYDKNDSRQANQNYLIINPDDYNSKFDAFKSNISLYAEANYSINERLSINPGIRYDFSDINKTNYFSPRISGSYFVNPEVSINFAAGIFYQMPGISTIAYNNGINLNNEKAIHYILGSNIFLSGNMKLTIETYYRLLSDLVVKPDRTRSYFTNSGSGWSAGVDISLIKRLTEDFYGQVNYSYSLSKRDDNNGKGEYNHDFNQPHMFNILAGYQINDEWSISAKWKYASGRPMDSYIIRKDVFINPNYIRYSKEITDKNNSRYKDFHTLNLRIDYRKQFAERFAVVAFIDIINLYSNKNENVSNFIEKTGKIDLIGMEMLPTFGFKIEI